MRKYHVERECVRGRVWCQMQSQKGEKVTKALKAPPFGNLGAGGERKREKGGF